MTPVGLADERRRAARQTALGGFAMPERMETERLVLTRPAAGDEDEASTIMTDIGTARFIGGVCDRAEAFARFASGLGHWVLRGFGMYTLRDRAGRYLGFGGAWFPEGWHEIEIGYALLPSAQGHGYATEAVKAVRARAFGEGAPELVSYIDPRNLPSQAVARRVGAVHDGQVTLMGTPSLVFRHPQPGAETAETVH
ncbi:MAG: GNAT family N-acetyltransferase [Pseudomonadota bacterium]